MKDTIAHELADESVVVNRSSSDDDPTRQFNESRLEYILIMAKGNKQSLNMLSSPCSPVTLLFPYNAEREQ